MGRLDTRKHRSLRLAVTMPLVALLVACSAPAQSPAKPAATAAEGKPAAATAPPQTKPAAETKPAEAKPAAETKPAAAPAPAGQKTIRVALTSGVRTFDPANYRDRNTETVIRNVFDGLYTLTPDGKPIPEIAEGVKQVDDRTWDFTIRKGITFHNGDPLTADDVQFTFDRATREGAMEGKTSPRQSLIGPVSAVEKVDDSTVRFRLSSPISETRMLYGTVSLQIMPKAHFQKVGAEELARNPVGAGPFKLVEARPDERIVLERYERYWGGSPELAGTPGPARVDRAIFQIIADPAARVAALRAGDIDLVQDVPADQVALLEADGNLQVQTARGTNVVYLAMNTQKPPFDDAKFRQAVAHAIDYGAIVTQLYGGRADALAGLPFIPGGEVDDPTLTPYAYDPERAKALLAEAGKGDASFVLDTHGDYNTLGQAIAQALGRVGVKAEVRQWEWAALQSAAQKGERIALIATFGNASLNPLWAYWVAGADQPANYSQYANPTFDGLMKKAPAIVDPAERARTFREAYAISYQELPELTLLTPRVVEAARKNVTGWAPSSAGRVNLHRVDLERR